MWDVTFIALHTHTYNRRGQRYSCRTTPRSCTTTSSVAQMHSACITGLSYLREYTNFPLSDAAVENMSQKRLLKLSLRLLLLLCFNLLLWWTLKKQTQGPVAVPNLSSHPECKVCYVCRRTLKYASSFDCRRCVAFHPSCLKAWRTHLQSFYRGGIRVRDVVCWEMCFFFFFHDQRIRRGVCFYANVCRILLLVGAMYIFGFIRKLDVTVMESRRAHKSFWETATTGIKQQPDGVELSDIR